MIAPMAAVLTFAGIAGTAILYVIQVLMPIILMLMLGIFVLAALRTLLSAFWDSRR